jgi:hypothetical protein
METAEDRALGYAREIARLRVALADAIGMLRLCEDHCSDGYVADQARVLLAHYDGSGDA